MTINTSNGQIIWTPASDCVVANPPASATRAVTVRVGLSGGNPWTDFALITGAGVLDETNSKTYKVGTLTVTTTLP